MPRRSAADIMPVAKLDRPPPPEGMPEPAAAIWRKTVASMKASWFTPESHDLLARYCGAMAEAARLEAEFCKLNVNNPSYERLTTRYDKMATLALSYARALRLTPKSNVTARDARDAMRSNSVMPWEDRAPHSTVRPWEG
jgi:hypothetical protein